VKVFVNNESGQRETVHKGDGVVAFLSGFIDGRS
jgi:hypothetical protein